MKLKTILVQAICMTIAISCSKNNEPNPSNTSTIASATVDGKAFTPTDNKATDTGSGLEIIMGSGDEIITLVTDDKIAGAYTIINISGGRVQAGTSAYGTYSKGTDTYNSKDGSVTLTVDANGNISGTFTLDAKNAAGTLVEIKDGKITGLAVTKAVVPAGKCLVSSTTNDGDVATLFYSGDGRLLKIIESNGGSTVYLWVNGKVSGSVSILPPSENSDLQKWDWYYDAGGKLHSATQTTFHLGQSSSFTETYTLNAAGQPVSIDFGGGVGTYTYDENGNCTSASFDSDGNLSAETYSGYDNKPNFLTNLWEALGVTHLPGGEKGYVFSMNNAATVELNSIVVTHSFTYTYDSKGNVISVAESGDQTTISYSCN